MTQVESLYLNAQLAFAAYANNLQPNQPPLQSDLEAAEMSPVQAAAFLASGWVVVDQYVGTSGVAATIFQKAGDPTKQFLAIRGTDGAGDINANGILASGFPWYLNPQFVELRTKVQAWIGEAKLTSGFTVTGHSLGGYLAAAIATEFRPVVGDTYMYNAPGVGGGLGNIFDAFRAAFGFGSSALVGGITNIRGTGGISPISGLGAQLAPPTFVETETHSDQVLNNHKIFNITDALAVYNAYSTLAPGLTLGQLGEIFRSASNETLRTQERSLDALRHFFGFHNATVVGDRNAFYNNLASLQGHLSYQALAGSASIRASNAGTAILGKQDFGDFLAAYYLLPVSIQGAGSALGAPNAQLYSIWQSDRANPIAETWNYTDRWFADRAGMLDLALKTASADFVTSASGSGSYPGLAQYFEDRITGERIFSGGIFTSQSNRRYFVFGSDAAETDIVGGNRNDDLFGGGGDDSIDGGGGEDYIEGNAGNDILNGSFDNDTLIGGRGDDVLNGGVGVDLYFWNTGDGNDTISDSDKRGRIFVNGKYVHDLLKQGNSYISPDGQVTGTRNSPLTLTTDDGATLVFADFADTDQGLLSIREVSGSDTAPTNVVNGTDLNDDNSEQGGTTYPSLQGGTGADELHGLRGDDNIEGLEGEDRLFGEEGRDWLDGWSGSDTLEAGPDADILMGWNGDDVLVGGVLVNNDLFATMEAGIDSDDRLPGLVKEFLGGGDDNDILIGGTGDDALSGGLGIDTIIGDAGVDVIWGDAQLAATSRDWTVNPTFVNIAATFYSAGMGSADSIYAGGGDDQVAAEGGDDYVDGGSGNDQISGHEGHDVLFGGAGNDVIAGDALAGDTAHPIPQEMEGDDYLDGEDGADHLVGGGGADTIFGGEGDDELLGDNNITPVAIQGDDYLDGEGGNDQLWGYAGNDEIYGGAGVDHLFGNEGDDYLDGEDGDDQLAGHEGNDTVFGGAGNDNVVGHAGDDYLDAEEGDDTIFAGDGMDTAFGGAGIDELQGGGGDDILDGGLDNDRLFGEGDADQLMGAEGDDQLTGGAGADTIEGGDGADRLFGDGDTVAAVDHGVDVMSGGLGNDYARGYGGNDQIFGNEGDDELLGEAGSDHIDGGSGVDFIWGDSVTAGAGDGNDTLSGGEGNDQLVGGGGADTLDGGSGDDSVYGEDGDDVLTGGSGNDSLVAGAGIDTLAGNEGNDSLWGEAGNDTLSGGVGNDVLTGGTGDDLYVFNLGDQRDTIFEETDTVLDRARFGTGIGLNDLVFSNTGAKLIVSHTNGTDELTIENWYIGTGYQLTVFEFADGSTLSGTAAGNLGLQLQRGTEAGESLSGTASSDTLYGFGGNDTLFGNQGNDTLVGGTGNDLLFGGSDSDTFRFELGDGQDRIEGPGFRLDTLVFGSSIARTDISFRRTGDDLVMSHANGADKVTVVGWYAASSPYQLDAVRFEAGGTVLTSAQLSTLGTDINDQYTFASGGGAVTIEDWGGSDTLTFAAPLIKADITPSRVGQDLVLTRTAAPADSVTIKNWFNNVATQVETVSFAGSGESFTHAELTDPFLTITGTSDNDALTGGDAYGETINGLAGNDQILGGGGEDRITGGLGNDQLAGGGGADRYFFRSGDGQDFIVESDNLRNIIQFGPGMLDNVQFGTIGADVLITFTGSSDSVRIQRTGSTTVVAKYEVNGTDAADTITGSQRAEVIDALAGNDVINGGFGDDEIFGGAGDDTIQGNEDGDLINGGDGNDIIDGQYFADGAGAASIDRLAGGRGNDELRGNSHTDWYYFNLGDGNDTIFDDSFFGNNQTLSSPEDEVFFGPGITVDNVSARFSGNDVIVQVTPTDSVTLKNWTTGSTRVEYLRFADGTRLDSVGIEDLANTLKGTAGNDTVTGTTANEVLLGLAGNDTLQAMGGNDKLTGGTGDDNTQGGDGNDTYFFNVGDGADTILETSGIDTLQFGPGLSATTTVLSRNLNSLVLTLNGTGDSVTIADWITNTNARVDNFAFADGSQLPNAAQIFEQLVVIRGTAGDDSLTGSAGHDQIVAGDGNDTLSGLADNDWLFGEGGNDTLIGGTGGEQLFGGDGDDLYQYASGDGSDAIQDTAGFDRLVFGAGISPASVGTRRGASDLFLDLTQTASTVAVSNYFSGQEVEEIRFADNTVWDVETVRARVLAASQTAGNDTIYGYDTNDTINALAGVDTVFARGGDDTVNGGLDSDSLHGEDGNDFIDGGTGADWMFGGLGNDIYVIDSTSDQAVENASEGFDTVRTHLAWTLGANLEGLTLTGTSNINATGNALDNTLVGNTGRNTLTGVAGNDSLDGGGGRDTFVGGTGNDTYIVDGTDDTVTELASEGTDTVRSPIAWTLGSNLENLVMTGTANINGTGNTLANVLTGNAGNNTLTGNAGSDTLDGGAGADTLIGGAGNDTYLLGRGYGAEVVTDSDTTAGNTDVAQFLAHISPYQIWFRQSGSNLVVSIIGTPDQFTISNWYSSSTNHVEQFGTSTGQTLLDTQVQNLVNAMAAFSPPAPGQTDLPPNYAATLNPVIAANWQ